MKKENRKKVYNTTESIKKVLRYVVPRNLRKKLKNLYFPDKIAWSIKRKNIKKFYAHFINKNDLVFDIGANKGQFTEIFAELAKKVIVLEPNKDLVKVLLNKFKKNDKIIVVPKGVSDKGEIKDFYVNLDQDCCSTFSKEFKESRISKHTPNWEKRDKIEMTTLDKLIEKYGKPKFIKIDVEGYEKEVLGGLNIPVKFLSFEFSRLFKELKDTEDCIKKIKKLSKNSKFNFSFSHDYEFVSEWGNPEKIIKQIKNTVKNLEDIKDQDELLKLWGKIGGDIYVKMF
ncbi:MAG: FkbM family methyltransferase [Nanoarchaeota archaeon]|nr:FkbM family methyltransferase [Nanoarchaeota archaeon]MBU1028056.1 FkbM family methyltransferase [Nanoarchaeota archaeon]